MYTLITIFYGSLIGMGIMLFLKSREMKTGRQNIVSRLGKGTDYLFHQFFSNANRIISYVNRHTFIALAHWIAFHILYRIRNIYIEIKHRALANPHGRRILNAVRGRAEVRGEGASIYLRRISTEEGRK